MEKEQHQGKKFIRTREDFICFKCDQEVHGTGYTDHCPNCLWSLHVDVNPGDRKAQCRGWMEPIGVVQQRGSLRILYKCQSCGYIRLNKVAEDDNMEAIIKLSARPVRIPKRSR